MLYQHQTAQVLCDNVNADFPPIPLSSPGSFPLTETVASTSSHFRYCASDHSLAPVGANWSWGYKIQG